MSFHGLPFVFLFLPVSTALFFILRGFSTKASQWWIVMVSVGFYAAGDRAGLPVLAGSVLFNFFLGKRLAPTVDGAPKGRILPLGIAANVLCLGFFKYAHALIPPAAAILFPLALSFYTFSQIAYLIELRQGKITQPAFVDYLVYVLFFPKLIAGPIARPSDFLPQLGGAAYGKWDAERIFRGLSFFFVGLFKKAAIADQLASYANGFFEFADAQKALSFYHAWTGMLTYAMQLYFDFSGYTDMAIGVALLLGIVLPLNFDAPYRSVSVTEFWRRWHMSLSSFLRDYVYIPLGGSRAGTLRKYANLMIVMVLCGMWHGSSFTFFLWGAIHGVYLVIHNVWTALKRRLGRDPARQSRIGKAAGWLLTFAAVTVAWAPFRATSMAAAGKIVATMLRLPDYAPTDAERLYFLVAALPPLRIALLLPTSQAWLRYGAAPDAAQRTRWQRWKGGLFSGLAVGCLAVAGLMSVTQDTVFIYKDF